MKRIQLLLLLALIIIFISYFKWFRSAVLDKLVIAFIFFAGIIFVLFPDATTKISSFLGVGRGTDLMLYVSIVSFTYIVLLLYSKIKKLENQLAELVRHQALLSADNFSVTNKNDTLQ